MDSTEFREFTSKIVDFIVNYFDTIRDRKCMSNVNPGELFSLFPQNAPIKPESWQSTMIDLEKLVLPGMTHWQSPKFGGYFNFSTSYPSMVGELLTSALNCTGMTWVASPICTELEMVTTDWLGRMMNLPDEFLHSSNGDGGGVIQPTTSESNIVALLAAKARKIKELKETHPEWDEWFIASRLVAYVSEQSHSSAKRPALITGCQIKCLPTNDENVLCGDVVQSQIDADLKEGLIPFYIIVTLGTTNSVVFDRLNEIGPICNRYNIWVHSDAAYAGAAFILPECQKYMKGIETTDSMCFNPHKWLLVSYDCCVMWFKNRKWFSEHYKVNATYVSANNFKFMPSLADCSLQFTRRFRALKLWFVLKMLGVEYLQNYLKHHIRLAKYLETLVRSDERFEVTQEVLLSLVCFRLKGDNGLTEELLQKIYNRGEIFLVPCHIKGTFMLRFVIQSNFIVEKDVDFIWNEISTLANEIVPQK